MSINTAVYSLGTRLFVFSGSAETEIGAISNFPSVINLSKQEIDVTHLNSTAKEYIAAPVADGGTMTFELQYAPYQTDGTSSLGQPVQHYLMQKVAQPSTSPDLFKVVFNGGVNYRFTASLLTFEVGASDPSTGILTANVTARLSGDINFESGSLA